MSDDLEQYVVDKKIKGVEFFGFKNRPHLFDFYNIADVFILPSEIEPWGIVVNEAMCFRLPIIASDRVGAALDLVKNGHNGFIFPVGDIKRLATCIEKISNISTEQRTFLGDKSFNIIVEWIKKNNPTQRILKILELLK
jgi:glycosyltransferase involved in cell wall biosynthesis